MAWRVAKSLQVLLEEINTVAPNRSKASDGSIGDKAHRDSASDHNPNSRGVVCARDFTHDPGSGVDMHKISRLIVKTRPRALKYVIWNRQIWSVSRASDGWRYYGGSNPHTKHMHVSVGTGADGRSTGPYDDTSPWGLAALNTGGNDVIGLKRGDSGDEVQGLQATLRRAGFDPGEVDGDYGAKTSAAVLKMRKAEGSGVSDGDNFTGWAYAQLMTAMSKKYGPGGGTVSASQIAAEVEKYLKAHPPKDGVDGRTPTKVTLQVDADVTGYK